MILSIEKLKTLRREKGWSQEVLAKATGLSVRTIQRIESDGKASAESTLSIASVFNLPPKSLEATPDEIKVDWTRKVIMKNFLALLVISGAITMLTFLAGALNTLIDGTTILFMTLFLYAATILTFGTDGMFKSLAGFKYLFTDEMIGGSKAQYLAEIYISQVKFLYGGALIMLTVGFIAILSNIDTYEDFVYQRSSAINLISLFYAAILSEGIFRPLSIKLRTCDIKG